MNVKAKRSGYHPEISERMKKMWAKRKSEVGIDRMALNAVLVQFTALLADVDGGNQEAWPKQDGLELSRWSEAHGLLAYLRQKATE